MKLNLFKNGVLSITLACLASTSLANNNIIGGISLGATRVIYPTDAKQVSLAIVNSNNKERLLINSWIENNLDEKSKDFIGSTTNSIGNKNKSEIFFIVCGFLKKKLLEKSIE